MNNSYYFSNGFYLSYNNLLTSSVLLYFIFSLRKKEKLIFSLFLTILFSFASGVVITHFRVTNAKTSPRPISKTNVFDIEAKVLEVKPTIGGSQLILDNVVILNKNDNNFGKIKVRSIFHSLAYPCILLIQPKTLHQ